MTAEAKKVLLHVLAEVFAKYERGASELQREFDLSDISIELLMHVCLAAPEVDDIILGFIRDDLCVVSLEAQTRRMAERDMRLLAQSGGGTLASSHTSLGRALQERLLADARALTSGSSELDRFIQAHPDTWAEVQLLRPSDLARWVMLDLMREARSRERGSGVLAAWRAKLSLQAKTRLNTASAHHAARLAADAQSQRRGARIRM